MPKEPTYEELVKKVKELENVSVERMSLENKCKFRGLDFFL